MSKKRKPTKVCLILVKGGIRCGKQVVPGGRCCREHLHMTKNAGRNGRKLSSSKERKKKNVVYVRYEDYIKSKEWQLKSREIRDRNTSCSFCNRQGVLHVHHRTYARLGNEKDSDLVVLCEDCHRIFHDHYEYNGQSGFFVRK